jgi:hypothetical protein
MPVEEASAKASEIPKPCSHRSHRQIDREFGPTIQCICPCGVRPRNADQQNEQRNKRNDIS